MRTARRGSVTKGAVRPRCTTLSPSSRSSPDTDAVLMPAGSRSQAAVSASASVPVAGEAGSVAGMYARARARSNPVRAMRAVRETGAR